MDRRSIMVAMDITAIGNDMYCWYWDRWFYARRSLLLSCGRLGGTIAKETLFWYRVLVTQSSTLSCPVQSLVNRLNLYAFGTLLTHHTHQSPQSRWIFPFRGVADRSGKKVGYSPVLLHEELYRLSNMPVSTPVISTLSARHMRAACHLD